MEFDGSPQSAVKDDGKRLPYDLHEPNSTEISAPFGQMDDGLLRLLIDYQDAIECQLDELDHFQPVGGVYFFLVLRLLQPASHILHLHDGGASRPVGPDPLYIPLGILLLRNRVVHQKGVHHHGDILPQGGHVMVQGNPFHYDLLDGDPSKPRGVASPGIVPPLRIRLCLLHYWWI